MLLGVLLVGFLLLISDECSTSSTESSCNHKLEAPTILTHTTIASEELRNPSDLRSIILIAAVE